MKVSGFFTSSVAKSKVGKKFFGLLPGEIVLASLDGFGMYNFYSFNFLLNMMMICIIKMKLIYTSQTRFYGISSCSHSRFLDSFGILAPIVYLFGSASCISETNLKLILKICFLYLNP